MHGDPRIIDLLNQVLRKELTGINQYFIHSRMCKNWGTPSSRRSTTTRPSRR
jgi:bacterioferritin